ncbi:MAG: hypothetical protein WC775_00205 [Patescibacteria group bacterium]|jgi:hypothetical protein
MKYFLPLLTLLFFVVAFAFPVTTLAWLQTYEVGPTRVYGFWPGLMHGFIAPFALIGQLFDNTIVLYSSVNNGFWYNLGFLLGISCIIGGGSKGTCIKQKKDDDEKKFVAFLRTIGIIAFLSAIVNKWGKK